MSCELILGIGKLCGILSHICVCVRVFVLDPVHNFSAAVGLFSFQSGFPTWPQSNE